METRPKTPSKVFHARNWVDQIFGQFLSFDRGLGGVSYIASQSYRPFVDSLARMEGVEGSSGEVDKGSSGRRQVIHLRTTRSRNGNLFGIVHKLKPKGIGKLQI